MRQREATSMPGCLCQGGPPVRSVVQRAVRAAAQRDFDGAPAPNSSGFVPNALQVDRLSITMDPNLGAAARRAAKRAKVRLSAWIAEATADRVRNELLGQALDRWEKEDGAFSRDELDAAARALAAPAGRKRRRG